ncbi:MAG: ATP-binding cassette domain-containing protein, partial [Coriobacteriia bacterium]|nr:ATP-binding cassette domain-containing protein [Coriobacteriia bacterium]
MTAAQGSPEGPGANAIDVRQVGVSSGGITLLAPTSFSTSAGRAIAIRGRNGSGKSTLLRVLTGQLAPSSGSVKVARLDVRRPDRPFRRRMASMIGLPSMAPDLTVQDHISLVAATWFDGFEQRRLVADQVVGEMGLAGLRRRFPHELSSGQRQLLGLSMVLARPFEVLVLDEPEQRLDAEHLQILADR